MKSVLASMAVVIIALAGLTGLVACSDDGGDGGGGATVQPRGWEAVSYKDKHDICHEFATITRLRHSEIDDNKYQACMQCGPDRVDFFIVSGTGSVWWYCRPQAPSTFSLEGSKEP